MLNDRTDYHDEKDGTQVSRGQQKSLIPPFQTWIMIMNHIPWHHSQKIWFQHLVHKQRDSSLEA